MPRKPARKKTKPSKRRNKNVAVKVKRMVAVASLFILSSLFLSGFLLYKKLTAEFASAFSASSYNILDEDIYSTALIKVNSFSAEPVIVEQIDLYIFDKDTLKTIKYKLPTDMLVEVPGRYGTEPFYNIYALGRLSNVSDDESAKLITKSIFKKMAFPVDRYLIVEDQIYGTIQGLFKGGLNIPVNSTELLNIKNSVKTNLDLREIIDIYSFTSSLPQDRIIEKEYVSTFDESPKLLNDELKDLTFDTNFANEVKSISILNGAESAGLANISARVIKNLGGRVVAIGNTDEVYEKSVLIVDDMTSESTRKIQNVLGIDNVILKSNAGNFNESEISRSDITVILGLDFAASM